MLSGFGALRYGSTAIRLSRESYPRGLVGVVYKSLLRRCCAPTALHRQAADRKHATCLYNFVRRIYCHRLFHAFTFAFVKTMIIGRYQKQPVYQVNIRLYCSFFVNM